MRKALMQVSGWPLFCFSLAFIFPLTPPWLCLVLSLMPFVASGPKTALRLH